MKQMAHALGKTDDEAKYAALFTHIQQAYQQAFVRADGFVQGADQGPSPFGVINNPNAKASGGDTQTGYVLTLHMRLVPDAMRAAVAQKLVDKIEANHGLLGTGFLGTPYLLSVLVDTGHRDVAYHLLLNTTYPSWGYLVDHGATTMWERWIYRYAAGVDTTPMDAGFHTVYLHPTFDSQLGSIDFTYPSPYGKIHSAWSVKGATASWQVTIPANASGWLPLTKEEAAEYMLDGKPINSSSIARADTRDGQAGYVLPAGDYSFQVSGVK
jgi:alpha-L-rhamnosidase